MNDTTITGSLEDSGQTLVLRRQFPDSPAVLWAALTDSETLGRWFGTWTGDPTSGTVAVTMNAEPGEAHAQDYTVHRCLPERELSVSSTSDFGTWRLTLRVADHSSGSALEFRHEDIDHSALAQIGPGWEWYLDRLAATLGDLPLPQLAEFEAAFAPQGEAYAALLPKTEG